MRPITLMFGTGADARTYKGALIADHGKSAGKLGRTMWECNHKHRTNDGAQRCAINQLGLMESMVDHFLARIQRPHSRIV